MVSTAAICHSTFIRVYTMSNTKHIKFLKCIVAKSLDVVLFRKEQNLEAQCKCPCNGLRG